MGFPFVPGCCRVAYEAFRSFERLLSLSATIADRSSTGRISKGPTFTPGCFEMSWMAWFKSVASRTRIPPSCSFVSAYGPSVMDTLPFVHRSVAAFRGLWSASPPAKCPSLRNTSSYAKHSSMSALCSVSDNASHRFSSKYPRQMYFMISSCVWVSRGFPLFDLLANRRAVRRFPDVLWEVRYFEHLAN